MLLKQHIVQLAEQSVFVSGFWVKTGVLEPRPHYILTDTVEQNLGDLAMIVTLCNHPVLVQCSVWARPAWSPTWPTSRGTPW